MRRRWKLDGDLEVVVIIAWGVVAAGGLIATALGSIPFGGDVRSWDLVIAVIWVLLAAIVPLLAATILGLRWLRRHLRRVSESGPDLREAYKR